MLPSNTYCTPSSLLTCSGLTALPLYKKAELREITKRPESLERSVMRSSVIPSLKYSCSGSLLILVKGSTTIDGCSGKVIVLAYPADISEARAGKGKDASP